MKKKLTLAVVAVVLVAAIAVGGSLAYFTDTDAKDNVFTVGSVKIALNEQQRNADGNALVQFENDKTLIPIVGSAQGEKDEFGLPTKDAAKNYVDKIVSVVNTGKSDCYVRVFVAIPHNLDDGADSYNAANNVLHFNFGSFYDGSQWVSTGDTKWNWKNSDNSWNAFETTIDEILYTVYVATYNSALEANASTENVINGFYLDKDVDCTVQPDGSIKWTKGTQDVVYPLENGVKIPVFAQAIQADGFATAADAFAASGLDSNPF